MQIYGLIDPRDNLIHYVGKTNKASRRLIEHRNEHGRVNEEKSAWIDSMGAAGYRATMTILETCEADEAEARELYWITYGRERGWPLVNKAHGYSTTARKILQVTERAVKLGLVPQQVLQFDDRQRRLLLGVLVQQAEQQLAATYTAIETASKQAEALEEFLTQVVDAVHELNPEGDDYGLDHS